MSVFSIRNSFLRPIACMQCFGRAQDGAMSVFGVFAFLTMATFGGMGIDLMMTEVKRAKLQMTMDSAVLAAANMDNQRDPEVVIRDYFEKAGLSDYLTSIEVDIGANYKIVRVQAERRVRTNFLRLLGYKQMTVSVTSGAEERVGNTEISLVLDISGSMGQSDKIVEMRDAAKTFVDTVLKDGSEDYVTVNLIPYSEHVNVGPLLFDLLPVTKQHDYAHCIEIPEDEFDTVAIDFTGTYEQAQYFQWYNLWNNGVTKPVCYGDSFTQIQPFSNKAGALKTQIDQLEPTVQTSIFLGIKWGAALLDPSMNGVVQALIAAGEVEARFSDRPNAYNNGDTQKVIVVMTDGQNTDSNRIDPDYYLDPSLFGQDVDDDNDGTSDKDEGLDYWANTSFGWELNTLVPADERAAAHFTKYSAEIGNTLQSTICSAAKAQNIIIWTIAFEAPEASAQLMRSCASSPSHYFAADGDTIADVFAQIGGSINDLRLVE